LSDLKEIRDYLQGQIQGIPDIGVVHNYHRYTDNAADLRALFKFRSGIRGWTITRESAAIGGGGGQTYSRDHGIVIRGYHQVQDGQASELTFQALCDLIVEKVEDDPRLGGNAQGSSPIEIRRITHVMFGGVLCHHAEMFMTAKEVRARQ
jgi:hypothetical protein